MEHPSEDSLFLMTQDGRNHSGPWRNNTPEQMSLPRAKRYGSNRQDSPPIDVVDRNVENDSPHRNEFYRPDDNSMRKRSTSPRYQKKDGSVVSKRSESPREYPKNPDEIVLMRKRNGRPLSPVNGRGGGTNNNNNRHSNPEYRRSYSPANRYDRKEIIDETMIKMSCPKNLEESIPREKSSISIENFRKKNDKGNMSPVGVVAPRRRTSDESSRNKMNEQYWDDEESYKRRIPGYKDKMKHNVEDNIMMTKEYNQQKVKRFESDTGEKMIMSKEKKLRENTMKLSPQERFLDAKSKFLMLEKERLKEQDKNTQNLVDKKRCVQDEAPISPEIIKNRPSWNRSSDESKSLKNQKVELVRRNSFFELDNDVKYYDKEIRG